MRVRVFMTAAVLACVVQVARGQVCDPGECTTDGMCLPDGTCQGTPQTGGSCTLSDTLCMVNGQCVNGVCLGDAAPEGTVCGGGCGSCEPIFPGVPVVQCKPDPEKLGQACDASLGTCFTGVCTEFGVPPVTIAQCIPHAKECPDIDGNPCTTDACNPATGQCEHSNQPPCVPHCEVCNPATSRCEPANVGAGCSLGFEPDCPVETSCQVLSGRGLCLPGTPSSVASTPTRTPTPGLNTRTPTATAPPGPTTPSPTPSSGECIGDCEGTRTVAVNNIITLVNIALGSAAASACPNGIPGSGEVNVAVIIQAVNNALNGCP